MTIALSALFTASVIGSKFDVCAQERAATGKTYQPFVDLLKDAYGLELPYASKGFILGCNKVFASEKLVSFATGEGSRVGAIALTQTLHAYCTTIASVCGAKVEPLPVWADPALIAAKKADRKAAKDKEAADQAAIIEAAKAAGLGHLAEDLVSDDNDTARMSARKKALTMLVEFKALLAQGVLTSDERDNLADALATCPTIGDQDIAKDEAKAKRTGKAKAKAIAELAVKVAESVTAVDAAPEAEAEAAPVAEPVAA